jgi:tetratricopeptide (TPR) repeat protein
MNRFSKSQVFSFFGALCLVVLIYWLPKTPTASSESQVNENDPVPIETEQTKTAIELVLGGEQPMKGIMGLLEILEKDSTNKPAILALGLFSIQSGQYDKATARFNSLLEINNELGLSSELQYLAGVYNNKGLLRETIQTIENFKTLQGGNQQMVELLNKIINEFKTYK